MLDRLPCTKGTRHLFSVRSQVVIVRNVSIVGCVCVSQCVRSVELMILGRDGCHGKKANAVSRTAFGFEPDDVVCGFQFDTKTNAAATSIQRKCQRVAASCQLDRSLKVFDRGAVDPQA